MMNFVEGNEGNLNLKKVSSLKFLFLEYHVCFLSFYELIIFIHRKFYTYELNKKRNFLFTL